MDIKKGISKPNKSKLERKNLEDVDNAIYGQN